MKMLRNEKGFAMVFVLILAAISLAMTIAMLIMVSRGSYVSGQQKRFRTAVEAGRGGMEAMFQLISGRGNPDNTLFSMPNPAAVQTKLAGPIASWMGLDNASTINPAVATSYDMTIDLGAYRVYTKIVNSRRELRRGRGIDKDGGRQCGIRGGDGGERPLPVHDRGALPEHDERHRTLETFHPVPILRRIPMRRSLPLLVMLPALRVLRRSEGAVAPHPEAGNEVSRMAQQGGGSPVAGESARAPGTAVRNSPPEIRGYGLSAGMASPGTPSGWRRKDTTPTETPYNSRSRGRRTANPRAPGTA